MRKIISAVLATTLLSFYFASPALAAANPVFYIDTSIPATIDQTVTVPINVAGNPGFSAVGLVVTYDPAVLQLTGVIPLVPEMPRNPFHAPSTVAGTQRIHFVNLGPEDWSGDGAIANLVFNVNPGASLGASPISLSFTEEPVGMPGNAVGNILAGTLPPVSGTVIINAPPTAGGGGDSTGGDYDGAGGGGVAGGGAGAVGQPAIHGNVNQYDDEPAIIYEVTVYTPPAPIYIAEAQVQDDVGGFIGVPHVLDDEGIPSVSLTHFGAVPQTGLPGFAGHVIAMVVSFTGSAVLWAWFIRHMYKVRKNGKESAK